MPHLRFAAFLAGHGFVLTGGGRKKKSGTKNDSVNALHSIVFFSLSLRAMADDNDAPEEAEVPTSRSAQDEAKAMNALSDDVRV